jgi:hypothetical protein
MDPRQQLRLPYGLSMMLGRGVALKGCAARTGKPASALDRGTAARPVAVMPLCCDGQRQYDSD